MIASFKGEYRSFSNFSYLETPLIYSGISYPSTEHFYVAMKTTDVTLRLEVANHPLKGLKAFGVSLPLRDDWECIKLKVMLYALREKFSIRNPRHRALLLSTGDLVIREGNWWGDKFWGFCLKTSVGENHLGRLMM